MRGESFDLVHVGWRAVTGAIYDLREDHTPAAGWHREARPLALRVGEHVEVLAPNGQSIADLGHQPVLRIVVAFERHVELRRTMLSRAVAANDPIGEHRLLPRLAGAGDR